MLYPSDRLYMQARQAKLFIDKYYWKAIDADDIAGKAFLSKFHFIRVFTNIYGATPHQYLISLRIEQAKKLLGSGKSVQETCTLVGFKSITSFTGLFRKLTGTTPAAFRQKFVTNAGCPPLPLRLAILKKDKP